MRKQIQTILLILIFFGILHGIPVRVSAAPETPELTALTSAGSGQITVSWKAVSGAEEYRIYRCSDNRPYTVIGNVNAGTLSFTDTTVTDGIAYQYTVSAVAGGAESGRNYGLYGTTSFVMPVVYDIHFTDLSAVGFTVTGKVYSTLPVARVDVPVWTEASGQDDIIWHQSSVSGSSFSVRVDASQHKNETGKYNVHFYAYDNAGHSTVNSTSVYATSVIVPNNMPELTSPILNQLSPAGYEATAQFRAPNGLYKAIAVTWTGNDTANAVRSDLTVQDGIVRTTVNTSAFGSKTGTYHTRFSVYDKQGYEARYTFDVEVPAAEVPAADVITISVGAGTAVLAGSNGNYMLFDSGPAEGAENVLKVLKQKNISHVSVLLTHNHEDHFGSLFYLYGKIGIDAVYMNDMVSSDFVVGEYNRQVFVKFLKQNGIPVYDLPNAGDSWMLGDLKAELVNRPIYDLSLDRAINQMSVWVRLSLNGMSFLITGDTQKEAEADAVNRGVPMDVDAVMVPHHGEDTSSSDAFLSAASPKTAVASGASGISADVRNRYQNHGITVLETASVGTVDCSISNGLSWYYVRSGAAKAQDPRSVYQVGDLNLDGKIDVVDGLLIMRKLNGWKVNLADQSIADVNKDGYVDVIDGLLLMRKLNGWKVELKQ